MKLKPQLEWRQQAIDDLVAIVEYIADLEHCFDADPQLAALTADLLEEVHALRRQLRSLKR